MACALCLAAAFPSAAEKLDTLGNGLGWGDCSSVDEAELEKERGGEGVELVQLSDTEMSAQLNQNSVLSSPTGNNIIGEGALNGVQGFTSIIQNSGNHVIIQESTIVNMTIQE